MKRLPVVIFSALLRGLSRSGPPGGEAGPTTLAAVGGCLLTGGLALLLLKR